MTPPAAIRRLLDSRDIHPKRSLGQSFLVNPRAIARLLDLSRIGPWDHVLEIGTGPGHLTLELSRRAAQVVGIELDPALADLSRSLTASAPNVRIIQGDGADLDRHLPAGDSWIVFSNLPYPSVQELLGCIFSAPPRVTAAVLMVQQEVYEKLAARPGTRAYGPLAVLAQATGSLTRLMRVAGGDFFPPPRVASVVFRWDRAGVSVPSPRLAGAHRRLQEVFRRRRRRVERTLTALEPRALLAAVMTDAAGGSTPPSRP